MTDDRADGARALAEGRPTHPRQDDDGTWYDVPCDCDRGGEEPPTQTQRLDQLAADLELLRTGGPVIDRAMREAGFLPEEPQHAEPHPGEASQ